MNHEFIVPIFSLALAINVFLCVWFIRLSENRINQKLADKQKQIYYLSEQIEKCFKQNHQTNERLAKTQTSLDAAFKVIAPKHLTVPKFRGE